MSDAPEPKMPFMSKEIDKLAAALSKAQAQIRSAAKDSVNPHFKSKYADLASVWEACRDPLTSNGLSVVQLPRADGKQVTLFYMLLHSSGQYISGELVLTAVQETPQAIGSAITYARRYTLAALVGIAQDDDDGNASTKSVTKNSTWTHQTEWSNALKAFKPLNKSEDDLLSKIGVLTREKITAEHLERLREWYDELSRDRHEQHPDVTS